MKYPPQHHQETNYSNVLYLAKTYPFATMITVSDSKPFVTHIPMIHQDDGSDYGKFVAHIDRYNPQTATLNEGAAVTCIFQGPDCYISPAIYSSRQLPTWNYIYAHFFGKVRFWRVRKP